MSEQGVSTSAKVKVSPEKIHAVIFDMDGVITQTAHVHAVAWKEMFDDYLKKRADARGETFIPFDSDLDYNRYVDGKPRIEGIKSFLESRDISLPMGSSEDAPDAETVQGMGTKKNRFFLDILKKEGIKPYQGTVNLIHDLKKNGIKVGVISSSKNAKEVLSGAGVLDLFEVRVDGIYSEQHNITGKPAPDIFLEAASQLGVEPSYSIVVEDAISGVQAGSKGGFALVIGVDRVGQEEELKKNGADVVVKDLAEVSVIEAEPKKNAIEHFEELYQKIGNKYIAIFLDYDGTMTPIVSRPDLAVLSKEARKTLENAGNLFTVAIISGRDRMDVEALVGVKDIFYAGSHGYDIAGPKGEQFQNHEAEEFLSAIDAAEKELKEGLSSIQGALVERKRYGVAAHYRLVADSEVEKFMQVVEAVHHRHLGLRKTTGKKVFELLPKINWNKGKALQWLLHCLELEGEDVVPFYIGDDVTDEDAFKVLVGKGIGIAVQEEHKPTFGAYTLKSPEEVDQFLTILTKKEEG